MFRKTVPLSTLQTKLTYLTFAGKNIDENLKAFFFLNGSDDGV
jgi:hypothetical protein